jgi:hypothetical protein
MINKKRGPCKRAKGVAKIVGSGQDKGQVTSLAVRRYNHDQ